VFHSTWSSPSLGEVAGRPLVFFAGGNGIVYAFEALTTPPPPGEVGKLKKVWSFDFDPTGPKENVHQYNSNRQVSPSNIYGLPVFHEGRLYVAGGGDLWWGKHEAWLKCLDAAKGTALWSYPLDRHVMATPAVSHGMIFIADCGRKIYCLDAATGQPHWTHEAKGDIWASPLVADGKLYIATRRKEVLVFAASKEKQLLSTVELDSPVAGSPVAANGTLFIATMKTLYAIGQTAAP
jgi:outer membrane protein assembly factor BamB